MKREPKFKVSNSKIKTWRRCKRQYYYKYILKLSPKRKASPLVRGTIIHDMIEAHIEGQDPMKILKTAGKQFKKLSLEEQEFYGGILEEIRRLMNGYFDFYQKDPIKYISYKGKKSEHYFEVDLTPAIVIVGYLDAVGMTKDKLTWLVEHKSHKQIPQGDLKYSDIQSAIYTHIMPKIGLPVPDGVIWNYIRAKAPTLPEVLKSGEMSRKANIDTLWSTYKEAVIKAGLKPKDYLDMEQQLASKESDFFVRKLLPVNKVIVGSLIEDAITTAREIKRKAGRDKTRNIDKHCEWCDYYNLCQGELRGLDVKFIKENSFEIKEKSDDEEETKYWE